MYILQRVRASPVQEVAVQRAILRWPTNNCLRPAGTSEVLPQNASRAGTRRAYERSLRQLKTDRLAVDCCAGLQQVRDSERLRPDSTGLSWRRERCCGH